MRAGVVEQLAQNPPHVLACAGGLRKMASTRLGDGGIARDDLHEAENRAQRIAHLVRDAG